MEDVLNELDDLYADFKKNAIAQMVKGNRAAGLRARKASLALDDLLKDFRRVSNELNHQAKK